jgi:vesicular inhibitory amino acid transporter
MSTDDSDSSLVQPPAEHLRDRKSNFVQSLFNSVNVLVGVGLLAQRAWRSLYTVVVRSKMLTALAFAQAGWILGPMVLVFCCIATNYTCAALAGLLVVGSSQSRVQRQAVG